MKTTIGGDRLGSGSKQEVSMRNYERSTHDLSYVWRSSMAAGTLVPFMSTVALPGDSMDIDLTTHVLTLPTIGPLFGSFKVQLDVFQIPIRLYNAKLHMNMLDIGLEMDKIFLPQIGVKARANRSIEDQDFRDNAQVGSSCILKYLGISGVGAVTTPELITEVKHRYFNAVPLLAYWEIFKNYYSNKQEAQAYVIHTDSTTVADALTPQEAYFATRVNGIQTKTHIYGQLVFVNATQEDALIIVFPEDAYEPNIDNVIVGIDSIDTNITAVFDTITWSPIGEGRNRTEQRQNLLILENYNGVSASVEWEYNIVAEVPQNVEDVPVSLSKFPLTNIDVMRRKIMVAAEDITPFKINDIDITPYKYLQEYWGTGDSLQMSIWKSQEGLAVKTYQSDLFNNWMDTEWIDGSGGINEITSIDTTGDSFTVDALNLASKVYVMLNRIAISGGSYDDWLDAVYTHERKRGIESPVYLGGLIKELTFEEVVSNAETAEQPLGTLAGRGTLTNKNKGGKINVKVDEPSYIMGIVSLTPRVDYSQGNKWDVNLKTLDDLHKPALDAIGFQDLITDQMFWGETFWDATTETVQYVSAGKQPAWINYMTDYNRTYGNFAEPNKEMFMTNNRRYEIKQEGVVNVGEPQQGQIMDLTTYIDPSKFNSVFAETKLDAQNFWVQIGVNNTARRKMSAKVIPNL